mgnify:CR=1 FL=1
MSEAGSHISEAKRWLSEFEAAETEEERLGILQHAKAAIENAEHEGNASA